jgi:hypothetical protein
MITELKQVWPDHGKPHYPQSQGSVERANGDIKVMLALWMADNNTQDWSIGIKFVQFQKKLGSSVRKYSVWVRGSHWSDVFITDNRNHLHF